MWYDAEGEDLEENYSDQEEKNSKPEEEEVKYPLFRSLEGLKDKTLLLSYTDIIRLLKSNYLSDNSVFFDLLQSTGDLLLCTVCKWESGFKLQIKHLNTDSPASYDLPFNQIFMPSFYICAQNTDIVCSDEMSECLEKPGILDNPFPSKVRISQASRTK